MNPFVNENPEIPATEGSFLDRFAEIPATIESRLPTLDKSLDAYFDRRFAAIIEEWELVTDSDLHRLETRLGRVTDEISSLYAGKMALDARVSALESVITSLEESR